MKDEFALKTFAELTEAVDSDTSGSRIKELAKLFLSAMTDWPTLNQTDINEFIIELKAFYGKPLTLAKIYSKDFAIRQEHDPWKFEAGSSIAEMIVQSNLFFQESDFDKIVESILKHYKI